MADRFRDLSQIDAPPLDTTVPAFYGMGSKSKEALEHLALINILELCGEAKVERCRATRDLSSCGRCVQHVLNSCGHASLCEECSKRCDVCPICRTLIPKDGRQLNLRLYYKCIEAGLISKQHDDRSQEREVHWEHTLDDIQRLYSLFDVALENNLVSLICHYVTDVCMNENAVSCDPVFAFLLDEVVVKDWCKRKFKDIVFNLQDTYNRGTESMRYSLCLLQKFALHLSGISNVLEVIISSFKETFTTQITDLHHLLENVVKTKQHLEIIIWCARHQFLRDEFYNSVNFEAWRLDVCERKSAAIKRSWPKCSSTLLDSLKHNDSTLFIEDALSNLGIEESYVQKTTEVDISCLQDDSSPVLFLAKIDATIGNGCYPFHNLRAAADILFLRGTSDMVVAKQAIFLYYLFDRHWRKLDTEWKYTVDDFAVNFGIPKRSLLESLVFYLLDDHKPEALQEAINIIPEITGPETHPKIAQVLLERERPEVALSVLRCSGFDDCFNNTSLENDYLKDGLLGETVTGMRVRIDCGLLTEAFMFQRMHYSKAKEKNLKHLLNKRFSHSSNNDTWVYLTEVLVTEFCHLCIRRNLVDRMIELPWNLDEEKFLHKCLFDHASQNPSSTCGSLLVVFYLQRYRFAEAYQVNCDLGNVEQNAMGSASEDVASRIQYLCQWRAGLIEKCLGLLPEVERQNVLAGNVSGHCHFYSEEVQRTLVSDLSSEKLNPAGLFDSSIHTSVLHKISRKSDTFVGISIHNDSSEFARKPPSVLQQRLLASFESTANMNAAATDGRLTTYPLNGQNQGSDVLNLHDISWKTNYRHAIQRAASQRSMKFHRSTKAKPIKGLSASERRVIHNDHQFHVETCFLGPFDFSQQAGMAGLTKVTPARVSYSGLSNGSVDDRIQSSDNYDQADGAFMTSKKMDAYPRREMDMEDKSLAFGTRWRSDESSEEEVDFVSAKSNFDGAPPTSRRRARLTRR